MIIKKDLKLITLDLNINLVKLILIAKKILILIYQKSNTLINQINIIIVLQKNFKNMNKQIRFIKVFYKKMKLGSKLIILSKII